MSRNNQRTHHPTTPHPLVKAGKEQSNPRSDRKKASKKTKASKKKQSMEAVKMKNLPPITNIVVPGCCSSSTARGKLEYELSGANTEA
jgi:hypothetical protein